VDFAACRLRFPLFPWNWPSFRSVPPPGTRRNWHRAIATVPGGCDAVTDPAQLLKRLRSRGWHGGPASVTILAALRVWTLALLTRIKHKEYYLQSRPICRIPLVGPSANRVPAVSLRWPVLLAPLAPAGPVH